MCPSNDINNNESNKNEKRRRDEDEQPFTRYTSSKYDTFSGWVVKRGRKSRRPIRRYMIVKDHKLYNHISETAAPSKTYDMRNARISTRNNNRNKNEIRIKDTISRKKVTLIVESAQEFNDWIYALKRNCYTGKELKIHDFYELGECIGEGINGDVIKGVDKLTKEIIAVKTIPMTDMSGEEIKIAVYLNHKNVIKTVDTFTNKTGNMIHMVMEYVAGGELRQIIDTEEMIPEVMIKAMIKDVLTGLIYLHDNGIIHRDIKLENILVGHECLKIGDFGSSAFMNRSMNGQLNSEVGTGYYLAPEMVQSTDGFYGLPVDCWALGVLAYVIVSKQFPFVGLDIDEYLWHVVNSTLEFPKQDWHHVSQDAMRFIERLLDKDEDNRITATQALHHPWLCESS